ncbi:hypothetical protein [Thaumasiovibrio sp. DFM-14]|uniref:hypothetical protein n=1 Tax=Thaumasiovibrio sp. DFM-14 TaxID=3384792 RepID=UPI0039A20E96
MNHKQRQFETKLETLNSIIETDPHSVLNQARQLEHEALLLNYIQGRVQIYLTISFAHWHLMNYVEGIKAVRKASKLEKELDTDEKRAAVCHLYALNYWGQAKYYTAQRYWLDTLENASLNSQSELEIEALIGLGNVWRITNALHSAEKAHLLALELAENAGLNVLTGKAAILLAWDRNLLKNYQGMLTVLHIAERPLQGYPSPTWQAEIHDFRALAYLGLNRLEEATHSSQMAIAIATQHKLTWMVAHSSITHARIAYSSKQYGLTCDLLESALGAAKQFDRGELLSQICKLLSENAQKMNDEKSALKYFRQYRHYMIDLLQDKSLTLGKDKAKSSLNALNQKAYKNINRLSASIEKARVSVFNHYVLQKEWQPLLNTLSTSSDAIHVLLITSDNGEQLNTMLGVAHSCCSGADKMTVLEKKTIAMALSKDSLSISYTLLSNFITSVPWKQSSVPQLRALQLHEFNQWWLGAALKDVTC